MCFSRCNSATNTLSAIVLTFVAFTVGCSSTPKLSMDMRAEIKTVSIDPNVPVLSKLVYQGGSTQRNVWFGTITAGLLGGIAAGSVDVEATPRAQIEKLMIDYDIDLGKMLVEHFEKALLKRNIFSSLVPTGGDATFGFEIKGFSLSFDGAFTSKLRPVVNVNAYMSRPNKGVVLSNTLTSFAEVSIFDSELKRVGTDTFDNYIANPEMLRKHFEQAIEVVVDKYITRSLETTL